MLTWTIQTIVISLVVIILIHNIYKYFKSNLTYPNVTDYIDRPSKKYNEILNTISEKNNNINYVNSSSSDMKEELKLFLNQQIKSSSDSTTNMGQNTMTGPGVTGPGVTGPGVTGPSLTGPGINITSTKDISNRDLLTTNSLACPYSKY